MRILPTDITSKEMDLFGKIYAIHSPPHNNGGIFILTYMPKHMWSWASLTPYGGMYNVHSTCQQALNAVESSLPIYEFDNESEFTMWLLDKRRRFDLLETVKEDNYYLNEIINL